MKTVDGFVLRSLGKEYIIVGEGPAQVDFNHMISLNASAAYLRKALKEMDSFEVGNLTRLLLEEYDVEEERAAKDAEAIAAKWLEIGIISK